MALRTGIGEEFSGNSARLAIGDGDGDGIRDGHNLDEKLLLLVQMLMAMLIGASDGMANEARGDQGDKGLGIHFAPTCRSRLYSGSVGE